MAFSIIINRPLSKDDFCAKPGLSYQQQMPAAGLSSLNSFILFPTNVVLHLEGWAEGDENMVSFDATIRIAPKKNCLLDSQKIAADRAELQFSCV